MKIDKLLLGKESCECGKSHVCPIKTVEIGKGVITKLPELLSGYKNIVFVADGNTYKAAGKRVETLISDKIRGRIVFNGDKILIPDERAIDAVRGCADSRTDLIIGVGSGVINDLCKYVSFTLGIPYYIVATAPSMDGYASVGAALILGGMKVTKNAHVPEGIVADTDVLKDAPMDMILAGYGDIIGKYSCLSDWKLSALINGEYICDFVIAETYEQVNNTRKLASRLGARDSESVKTLMEALVAVGILMAYVGNSRPASGSEHHFSHYFEITGIVKGEEYLPHGADVFYSAAETAKIREKILSLSKEDIKPSVFNKDKYESEIKRVYGAVADEVIALQNKLGWYSEIEKRVSVYKEKLDGIKEILSEAPSFADMREMLSEVGMSYADFIAFYGEDKINDGYLYAKDLKDRYTVLWTYYDLFAQ